MTEEGSQLSKARLAAVDHFDAVIRSGGEFSYTRVSDGEWRFLNSGDAPRTGLVPALYERFLNACVSSTYLDLCYSDPGNRGFHLGREPRAVYVNNDPETGKIIGDWTTLKFRDYAASHTCLFVGAESKLLEAMLRRPDFRSIAAPYWSEAGRRYFLTPPHYGNDLVTTLESLKDLVRGFAVAHQVEAIFFCLGGPAKILASELADELQIACVDWGSQVRGFTYSGSRLDNAGSKYPPMKVRPCFLPFFYRLPISIYLEALREAHPELSPSIQLQKALCQLRLELTPAWRGENSLLWHLDRKVPPHLLANPQNVRFPRREDRQRLLAQAREGSRYLAPWAMESVATQKHLLQSCWEFLFPSA